MNLGTTYQNQYLKELQAELGIANVMSVPKLSKIVINVGLGEALTDKKVVANVITQLTAITGQKPAPTKSKVSISSFKLRAGEVIGVKVTLRGKRMYDFFEKLIHVVLPKTRDFRGVPRNGFDGAGNYSLGLSEQIIFPEIEYGMVDKIRGLEITMVTKAGSKEAGMALLKKLGMPFEKEAKH